MNKSTKNSHFYFAHGLNIESEVPLPELSPGISGGDLQIRLGKVDPPDGLAETRRAVSGTADQLNILWSGVGGISIRGGQEIVVDPAPAVDEKSLRLIILGPALGIALIQRGLPVFHASCVASSSGAVAFAGPKGSGKSTMAVALHRNGYDLVTDDILSIDNAMGKLLAKPSFPQSKLWPDSVEAMGEAIESMPLLHPDYDKRVRPVSQGFAKAPVPLRCLFLLGISEDIEIAPLPPTEAWLGTMPHWYGAQFDGDLLRMLGAAAQLHATASLAKNIPVYHLKRPLSLEMLPEVARMVAEYVP